MTNKQYAPLFEEATTMKEVNFLQSEEQDAGSTLTDEVQVDRQNRNNN